ncbi:hypothetical protein A1O3_08842 [Capronia epimyces CBS 606.96]|uniref:Extracellular membrane protein CFEM domain-containing protein n=1 Tax=Capronia epimyces CBS 606.96 TaxID=1182542 RepID=W9XPW5_9EURO|nr:uncharacterized protein A1O3_08842 [Capronia epimyces CBS 606.96]EXJ79340.1 hypothetical protein A1O3_08842 [Capronia epimyces CBS 606.96]
MSSPRPMRLSLSTLAIVLVTLFRRTSAQNIVPTSSSSSFPGCALSCTVLLQAQSLCVPPNVPTTSEITYENCFCQSSLLQALYGTPDSICAGECTIEADRQLLQTWFTGFCAQVGKGVDPLASTATTSPTSATVVTVTSTSPPQATNTATGSTSASASSSHQSWIEGHWRWILMLGILAVGFALLTWLAIWLKRRHGRKVEERRATISGFPTASEKRDGAHSATPDLWGPHQHMHHTKGWEYSEGRGVMGSGALGAAAAGKPGRQSKRLSSSKDRHYRNHNEMADENSRPIASRQQSSKGKARASDEAVELDPEIVETDGSRDRGQKRRNPERARKERR